MRNNITDKFVQDLRDLYENEIKFSNDLVSIEVAERVILINRKKDYYVYLEDPILDLIQNYNIENFQVAGISFYTVDDMIEDDNYIGVGSEGAGDIIAIKKSTKQIVTIDGYFDELLVCSETSEQFLNNLVKISRANLMEYSFKNKYELAKKLSSESKGDLSFYREALGAFEE
jgi:hypothetical protein